jgi:hypothetical protein
MTITLTLSPEVEQRLTDRAARDGLTVELFVQRLVEQSVPTTPDASSMPYEEWRRLFLEWAASHPPLPGSVDDDRDSIYAGRGE